LKYQLFSGRYNFLERVERLEHLKRLEHLEHLEQLQRRYNQRYNQEVCRGLFRVSFLKRLAQVGEKTLGHWDSQYEVQ